MRIREEMTRVFDVTRLMGGDYELKFQYGGPPMVNDEMVSEVIKATGKELLGIDNVHEIRKTMGAEDFSEFLNLAPGAMFTLGVQKKGHEEYKLHHPKFDLDERALPVGTAMLVETAKRFLAREQE
jgi:metal-dependent amidase/aminoacylase/carboxypeptidase family protein